MNLPLTSFRLQRASLWFQVKRYMENTIHRISFKARFPAYGAKNKQKNPKKAQFVFTPTSRSTQVSCRQFVAWSKHYIYPKVVIRAQMLNNTIVSIKQAAT